MDHDQIVIPSELRPADGRFGAGPSKVRPEALAALERVAPGYLGTSHRQAPVRSTVRRLKEGLEGLFGLPDGYEVVLGTGGTTAFWDAMVFSLIERRSAHAVFGEFSTKFMQAVALAPHLLTPVVAESDAGSYPELLAAEGVDTYALTHNETSTGVAMPVRRIAADAITAVDATSAAGGLDVEAREFDVYYFSPQKGFGSDAGIWVALCSPRAIERIERLAYVDRYVPPSLDLCVALENSRRDQTYNTPPLVSLFLMAQQVEWMLSNGGLRWAVGRCARSADVIYGWAEKHPLATPFVADPNKRSPVVATIDFEETVTTSHLTAVLRSNGILDTEPYRKLGRNQLRVALYPAIEPSDVGALASCIDFVVDALA